MTDPLALHPVSHIPGDDDRGVEDGLAVCLSGGGYRAMLFHAGSLWRMLELGLLSPGESNPQRAFKRLSSVSGGSITSALLGLRWSTLDFSSTAGLLAGYQAMVVDPLRRLASVTLAANSSAGIVRVLEDVFGRGTVNEKLERAYDKHLFHGAALTSLPGHPRWVINATNLQSGALWRFMAPYMRDWKVGESRRTDKIPLARAVAASSAFPPFLAPATLALHEADFTDGSGADGADGLQRPPFTTQVQLADGGVYDNLGLETAYKRYQTLLVSDAGAPMQARESIARNGASQGGRAVEVMGHQVRSLRVRLLVNSFRSGARHGAYWSIDTDLERLPAVGKLPCSRERIQELAAIPTDLGAKQPRIQERLINLGYAACDASLRAWFDRDLAPPAAFPYPASGV